jgi:hypothetical protein
MNKLFLIILFGLFSGGLQAQVIAKNEVAEKVTPTLESANIPSAPELPSYHVNFKQNKTGVSFEVISPKSEKAELKLVNAVRGDVCLIHKGLIHSGKNVYTVPSRKLPGGTYYVLSTLADGEQFADKIVVKQ